MSGDVIAAVAVEGGVHEMQDSILRSQRESDMGGGIKSAAVPRNNPDHVAVVMQSGAASSPGAALSATWAATWTGDAPCSISVRRFSST